MEEPRLNAKESMRAGFRTVNRCWGGVVFYTAWWVGWHALIVALSLSLASIFPGQEGDQGSEKVQVQQNMLQTDSGDVTPGGKTSDEQVAAGEEKTQAQQESIVEWFPVLGPFMFILIILFLVLWTWIYGGLLGYLAQKLRKNQTGMREFLHYGSHAFGRVLSAYILFFCVIFGGGFLGIFLPFSTLWDSSAATILGSILKIIAILAALAVFLFLVCFVLRSPFWFIAVVADGEGPIAGLKKGFSLSRGHLRKLFELALLLFLIQVAIHVVFFIVQAIIGVLSSMPWAGFSSIARVLALMVNISGQWVGSVYMTAVSVAAFIHLYDKIRRHSVSVT